MNKIEIKLNGEDFLIEEQSSIYDLIRLLDLDVKKIAIEKNLEIIDLNSFDSEKIEAKDNIEIVHFIGGG